MVPAQPPHPDRPHEGHGPDATAYRDIVVVGASAGGVEALKELVSGLPADFPAALFVVLHMPAEAPSVLPRILARAGPLPATTARDGEPIRRGHIYVAPPDHHLLLQIEPAEARGASSDSDGRNGNGGGNRSGGGNGPSNGNGHGTGGDGVGLVRLSRGPRENGHRPALDPLFRTAAVSYGARVIGVVLSGNLDDGTAGLAVVKSRGGLAVAQDPSEALYPGMPLSATQHVEVDRVLPVGAISAELDRMVRETVRVSLPESTALRGPALASGPVEVPTLRTPPHLQSHAAYGQPHPTPTRTPTPGAEPMVPPRDAPPPSPSSFPHGDPRHGPDPGPHQGPPPGRPPGPAPGPRAEHARSNGGNPQGWRLAEIESDMAALEPAALHHPHRPGVPSGFACPECGGALFELEDGVMVRFRCRVGHAMSANTLLGEQAGATETALWIALRALEESSALCVRMGDRAGFRGDMPTAAKYHGRAETALRHAESIRRLLVHDLQPGSGAGTPGGTGETTSG